MFKKIKYFMTAFVVIAIIFCGFIKVSSELPDFIKDRSPIKVTYSKNPLDLKFDIGEYVIYINKKAFDNIKNKIINLP